MALATETWPVAWRWCSARIASSRVRPRPASRSSSRPRSRDSARAVLAHALQDLHRERHGDRLGQGRDGVGVVRGVEAGQGGVGRGPPLPAVEDLLGQPAQVLDQGQLQHAGPGPQLADGQGRHRLVGGHEAREPLRGPGGRRCGGRAPGPWRGRARCPPAPAGPAWAAPGRTSRAGRGGRRGPPPRSGGSCRAAIPRRAGPPPRDGRPPPARDRSAAGRARCRPGGTGSPPRRGASCGPGCGGRPGPGRCSSRRSTLRSSPRSGPGRRGRGVTARPAPSAYRRAGQVQQLEHGPRHRHQARHPVAADGSSASVSAVPVRVMLVGGGVEHPGQPVRLATVTSDTLGQAPRQPGGLPQRRLDLPLQGLPSKRPTRRAMPRPASATATRDKAWASDATAMTPSRTRLTVSMDGTVPSSRMIPSLFALWSRNGPLPPPPSTRETATRRARPAACAPAAARSPAPGAGVGGARTLRGARDGRRAPSGEGRG